MAFCPQCGREQRCGCETCHICGTRLVEAEPAMPPAAGERSGRPEYRSTEATKRIKPPQVDEVETSSRKERVLSLILVIIGCSLLVLSVVEMVRAASQFPGEVSRVAVTGEMKRMGYYVGNLMYVNTARVMVGLALATAGIIVDGGPFAGKNLQQNAARLMCLVLFAVGALYLVGPILIAIPGESPTVVIRGLLPSLYFAIPVLIISGLSLITCSASLYLWFLEPPEERSE